MSSRRTEILKSRAQRRVLARKSCQEMDESLGSGGHGSGEAKPREIARSRMKAEKRRRPQTEPWDPHGHVGSSSSGGVAIEMGGSPRLSSRQLREENISGRGELVMCLTLLPSTEAETME